ncbi:MAG TPA: hypothetical protein VF398_01705 [bacterium]|jgi:predicted transcriptional regulator
MRKVKVNSPKEEVRKILSRIPDDVTLEDIQYHIYVREKIERGLKDLSEGRLLSQEEVEQRMARWLGK